MQKGGKSICTHDLINIAFKKWGLFSSFQAIFKVAAAAFSALNAHESMQKGGKSICTHDLINIAFRKWAEKSQIDLETIKRQPFKWTQNFD